MRRRNWITSATLLVMIQLLFAGGRAQADDSSEVRAANEAYYAALSARDIDATGKVWARGNTFNIFAAGRSAQMGWDAIRAAYEDLFKRFPELSITMADPAIRQDGDTALVIGIETLRARSPNGDPVALSLPATNVFRRQDGQWRMIHHHTSRPPT